MQTDCAYLIFGFLAVKEISTLSRLSKFHREVINNENFRKKLVNNNFGVDVKRIYTWRHTSIYLGKITHINLKKKWVNGMTYQKILDDTLKFEKVGVKCERVMYLYYLSVKHYPWSDSGKEFLHPIYNEDVVEFLEKCVIHRKITFEERDIFKRVHSIIFSFLKSFHYPEEDIYSYLMDFSSMDMHSLGKISMGDIS